MKGFSHLPMMALLGLPLSGLAQTPASAHLEINNIRSVVRSQGTLWQASANDRVCEFPKGSGKHLAFAGSLWIGGFNNSGQLRVAGNTWGSTGVDYWPGPLTAAGTIDSLTSLQWDRVWKINRAQIDSARQAYFTGIQNLVPAIVREWPAKGNTTAKGANGALLAALATTTQDYAPFVDVNNNGIYDWSQGDYPKIKGDEFLWTVFNDALDVKTQSKSATMKLEIQLSAYAYTGGSDRNNMQFFEYKISNRGQETFDSCFAAVFADLDLGFYADDYIGYRASRRMGYQYNFSGIDGIGQPDAYGANPPVAGIVLLEGPGDAANNLKPANAFVGSSANGSSAAYLQSAPGVGLEFYRNMTGKNRSGSTIVGGGSYHFPGNPNAGDTTSECGRLAQAGDRSFSLTASQFKFMPGSSVKLAFALVAAPNAGNCGNLNLAPLTNTADTALKLYWNPPTPSSVPAGIATTAPLRLYPNPVRNQLMVESDYRGSQPESFRIIHLTGQSVPAPIKGSNHRYEFDLANLPAGVYLLLHQTGNDRQTYRFVKD